MTVEIIQPIACKNCTHAFWQGQNEYLCRRYPPTAVTVLGPGKNGPEVKGVFGIYPPTPADNRCGEFQRAVIRASDVSELSAAN